MELFVLSFREVSFGKRYGSCVDVQVWVKGVPGNQADRHVPVADLCLQTHSLAFCSEIVWLKLSPLHFPLTVSLL